MSVVLLNFVDVMCLVFIISFILVMLCLGTLYMPVAVLGGRCRSIVRAVQAVLSVLVLAVNEVNCTLSCEIMSV